MRSALAASTFLAAVPLLLPAGVAYAACNTSDTNQTCTNNATISGGAVGVFDTGTLTLSNIAPGSITGSNRGLAAAAAVIVTTNTGSITGTTDDAIFAGTNATVTNNAGGTVTGGFNGIAANIAAEVINSGTITAPNFTIFASNVTVTNNVGGTITGIGAIIAGVNANVTNSGHIGGGISASTNATVTNNIGGTITSNFFGIRANSGTANVFNFGSITGTSGIVAGAASTVFNAGTVTGTGGTAMSFGAAGSNLTIAPTSIINGNVLAAAGSNTFQLGGTGTGTFDISALGPAQQYQNFDIVNKVGASTWTATGTSTYAGATTVNAGTLSVNGDISSSSGVTVNNGGTLGGTGILPSTVIASGGTLAPGNSVGTITVNGNLTFNGGSTYAVEVSGAAADRTNVTGTATLAGTVQAAFASVTMLKQYTILHSAGLVGTFGAFTYTNPNISAGLSYTATDVLLNVTGASLGAGGSLTGNQQNVAGSINTFFNNGGTLPPAFGSLFGLTGGNLGNALSQLSGEAATGSQQSAFQLTNQFFGIMLDPFADGRDGIGGGPALGFAREGAALPDDAALAYASALKPPATNASFEQRWSAWGSAYGGVNNSSRDSAAVGSHDLTARAYGFAVGFDYRVSRDTVVGFALAGAGTNWGLSDGLGGGKSDAFQAGAYAVTRAGPAYLAGALNYAAHWMSTDRLSFGSDHLTANFMAHNVGARIETGYRFGTAMVGFTPYGAVQGQVFRTPSYSETDVTGGGFGLSYDARTATAVRTELGARFDQQMPAAYGSTLVLRGRAAWAYDHVSDAALTASFQSLPGASFTVNGAAPVKNSALLSGGSELRFRNGWSTMAKLDGEIASRSYTVAATAKVKYAW